MGLLLVKRSGILTLGGCLEKRVGNQLTQLKMQTQAIQQALLTLSDDQYQWSQVQPLLNQLGDIMQKTHGLSFKAEQIDAAFKQSYPGYQPPTNFSEQYRNNVNTTQNTFNGVLQSLGMSAAHFQDENRRLAFFATPSAKCTRSNSGKDQRLINFAINQFVIHARTVVHDSEAQKALLDKVYAYSANQALPFLHDYYQKNNPFDRASHSIVTVNIVSSLPITKDTWQITWDEAEHNVADGAVIKTTRWIANITYQLGEVNSHFMLENPFGLYITQINWTEALRGEAS